MKAMRFAIEIGLHVCTSGRVSKAHSMHAQQRARKNPARHFLLVDVCITTSERVRTKLVRAHNALSNHRDRTFPSRELLHSVMQRFTASNPKHLRLRRTFFASAGAARARVRS